MHLNSIYDCSRGSTPGQRTKAMCQAARNKSAKRQKSSDNSKNQNSINSQNTARIILARTTKNSISYHQQMALRFKDCRISLKIADVQQSLSINTLQVFHMKLASLGCLSRRKAQCINREQRRIFKRSLLNGYQLSREIGDRTPHLISIIRIHSIIYEARTRRPRSEIRN